MKPMNVLWMAEETPDTQRDKRSNGAHYSKRKEKWLCEGRRRSGSQGRTPHKADDQKPPPTVRTDMTRYQHTAILLWIWLMPTESGATAETTDFKCQTKGKKTETKQSDGCSIIVSIRRYLLVLSVRKKYYVIVCPNVLVLWNCVWKQYLA